MNPDSTKEAPAPATAPAPAAVVALDVDDPSLVGLAMKEQFEKCFPIGSIFPDRHILYTAVQKLSAKFHFHVVKKNKTSIQCSCNGFSKCTGSGQRMTPVSFKTGCKWALYIRGMERINGNYRLGEGDKCKVMKLIMEHNCNPSADKYGAIKKRSGACAGQKRPRASNTMTTTQRRPRKTSSSTTTNNNESGSGSEGDSNNRSTTDEHELLEQENSKNERLFSSFLPPPAVPIIPMDIDDPSLEGLTMKEQFQKCFPVGSRFIDRHVLFTQINKLAARHHFLTNKNSKTSIACACAGSPRSNSTGARRVQKSFKTNCKWAIKILGTTSIKGQYRLGEGDECRVTKLHLDHNCNPTPETFIFVKKRAGHNTSTMSTSTKYLLCMMILADQSTPDRVTPTASFRTILSHTSPDKSLTWTSHEIWNVKSKILRMLEKLPPECLESYELFKDEVEGTNKAKAKEKEKEKSIASSSSSSSDKETDATTAATATATGAVVQSDETAYYQLRQHCNEIANLSRRLPRNTQEMISASLVALKNIARHGSIGKNIDPKANASEQLVSFWQRFLKKFERNSNTSTSTSTSTSTNNSTESQFQKSPNTSTTRKRPLSSVENQNTAKRSKDGSNTVESNVDTETNTFNASSSGSDGNENENGNENGKRCTFCGQSDHDILNCKAKKQFGFVVANVEHFKMNLTKSYPFGRAVEQECTTGILALPLSQFKHLQVHSFHPKGKHEPRGLFQSIEDSVVCITIINDKGAINVKLKRVYMNGKEFLSVIDMIGKNSARFLFDDVILSSQGKEFTSRKGLIHNGQNHGGQSPAYHHMHTGGHNYRGGRPFVGYNPMYYPNYHSGYQYPHNPYNRGYYQHHPHMNTHTNQQRPSNPPVMPYAYGNKPPGSTVSKNLPLPVTAPPPNAKSQTEKSGEASK